VVELQSVVGLKIALRAFGRPRLAYGAVPSVTGRFTRAHRIELAALEGDAARFRYVDVSGVGYDHLDCRYTAALLSSIPKMFGSLPAEVRHSRCALRGASECVYELRWEYGPSGARPIVVGLAATGLALGASKGPRALADPAAGAVLAARRSLVRLATTP